MNFILAFAALIVATRVVLKTDLYDSIHVRCFSIIGKVGMSWQAPRTSALRCRICMKNRLKSCNFFKVARVAVESGRRRFSAALLVQSAFKSRQNDDSSYFSENKTTFQTSGREYAKNEDSLK